jgi:hypothetical protein
MIPNAVLKQYHALLVDARTANLGSFIFLGADGNYYRVKWKGTKGWSDPVRQTLLFC